MSRTSSNHTVSARSIAPPTVVSASSYSYTGERDHTIRHGYGKLHFANPYFHYEGNYVNGIRHGPGTLYLGPMDQPDLVIKGTFINGEIHGWGTKLWKDGKMYTGEFKNGEIEGQGRIEIPNEHTYYEGEFLGGAFHGTGKQTITITTSSSSSPLSSLNNDTERNTDDYAGVIDALVPEPVSVKHETMHKEKSNVVTTNRPTVQTDDPETTVTSPLIVTTASSTVKPFPSTYTEIYTGEFRHNKREGQGKLERDSNHPEYLYEGNFLNNQYHGEGILYYDNNGYYHGEWYEGKKHGNGKLVFPKHIDTLSFSGIWKKDLPLHLPSSFAVHVLPWKYPKITSWPPPPPAPVITESVPNTAATTKPGTNKGTVKPTSNNTASNNTKGNPTAAPVVPPNPFADLPLYRSNAVVVPVGGRLPTIKMSVMYINPEKKAIVEERRAKEAMEAAAKAAEEAAKAAAEAERKRLEMEAAAAANKGKKTVPAATTSPSKGATTATTATSLPTPVAVPPSNPDGWKNMIEEYEEPYTGENGRHIELILVPHETIQTQFSAEIVKAREAAQKAAEEALIASSVTDTVSAMATKGGSAATTKTNGSKLTTPPTSPKSPSKLKSSVTKISSVTSFMRIPSSPTLASPPSVEPPADAPAVSVLVPSVENSQREDPENSLQNEINGTESAKTEEDKEEVDLSTLLSTNSVHRFTNQGTDIIRQVYIPLTMVPGQYTLIVKDRTTYCSYGTKLKTVYIPIDILPTNAW